LVAAANFLAAATKNLFVIPNFVAVTKPFFFRVESGGICYILCSTLILSFIAFLHPKYFYSK